MNVRRQWDTEKIIAAIQVFTERYGRAPSAADFSPALAKAIGHE